MCPNYLQKLRKQQNTKLKTWNCVDLADEISILSIWEAEAPGSFGFVSELNGFLWSILQGILNNILNFAENFSNFNEKLNSISSSLL